MNSNLNSRRKNFQSIAHLPVCPVTVDQRRHLVNRFTLQPSKKTPNMNRRQTPDVVGKPIPLKRSFGDLVSRSLNQQHAYGESVAECCCRTHYRIYKKTLIENSLEMFEFFVLRSVAGDVHQTSVFSSTLSVVTLRESPIPGICF